MNKVEQEQKRTLNERIKLCRNIIIEKTKELEECKDVLKKLGGKR